MPFSPWAAKALSWTSAIAESGSAALRVHVQAGEEGGLPNWTGRSYHVFCCNESRGREEDEDAARATIPWTSRPRDGGRRVQWRGASRPCPSWSGGRLTEPIEPRLPDAPLLRVAGSGQGRIASDNTLHVPSLSRVADALSWTLAVTKSSGETLGRHFQA